MATTPQECERAIKDFLLELDSFVNYKRAEEDARHVSWWHGVKMDDEEIKRQYERQADTDGRMAQDSWGRLQEQLIKIIRSCKVM